MSKVTNPTNELANSLIAALGLPQNVTRLVLTLDASKPPLVECEFIPGSMGTEGVLDVVKGKYTLIPTSGEMSGTNTIRYQRIEDDTPQEMLLPVS